MEVRLPHNASFETWLESILSIMVHEWPVTPDQVEKRFSFLMKLFVMVCLDS